ncbi:MAG: hypothetical protein J5925_06480 [Clostridia bacterium]|nr:hypothetical protein [Clostridia bacterium]MBR5745964.1 hypothetical protein [Clostridia bacterium]
MSPKRIALCFFAVFAALCLLPASRLIPWGEPAAKLRIKGENGVYELDIETFVARGVNARAGDINGPETACALAAALRSCAVYALENGCKHSGCEFCEDPACCFPLATETGGIGGEAAKRTAGEVLYYNGLAAPALYTVCSGTGTRDCAALPFNTAVKRESACAVHCAQISFTMQELCALFGADPAGGACFACGENGYCEFAVIGGKAFGAEEVIQKLALPSALFRAEYTESGALFTVYGEGRGYGLDICRANGQESGGAGYREILKTAFPQATLKKRE